MRHCTTVSLACGTAAYLACGAALAAPETHDGFFLRLGANLGYASVSQSVEAAGIEQEADLSGFQFGEEILLGGSVIPGLVVGGGLVFGHTPNPTFSSGNLESELDGTMLFLGATAFVNYYIDPNDGLNLQGLLGYSFLDFVSADGASGGNDPSGPMFGVGVGYDFWIGSEWSVGPFGRVIIAPVSVDQLSATYIAPTIGAVFTYH